MNFLLLRFQQIIIKTNSSKSTILFSCFVCNTGRPHLLYLNVSFRTIEDHSFTFNIKQFIELKLNDQKRSGDALLKFYNTILSCFISSLKKIT